MESFFFFQLLFDFSTFSRVCAHLVPASWLCICAHSLEMKLFLEHNVNSLIILTEHPATQEITENWKISGNFVWYSTEEKIISPLSFPLQWRWLKNSLPGAGRVLVIRTLQSDGYLPSWSCKPSPPVSYSHSSSKKMMSPTTTDSINSGWRPRVLSFWSQSLVSSHDVHLGNDGPF